MTYPGSVRLDDPAAPTLDRSCEPWVGWFPGLGGITVAADGTVETTLDPQSDEDATLRAQALRYGWGEGLSLVRRGFDLAGAVAAVPPQSAAAAGTDNVCQCTLLAGDPHDVAIVIADLVDRGWTVMSDRYTPVRWEEDRLIAHPREAPILMASRRARKLNLAGTAVRDDTDAVAVEFPRHTGSARVTAVVKVTMRRPHEDALTPLTGQTKFESAAGLMLGGVMRPGSDGIQTGGAQTTPEVDDAAVAPVEAMSEHLRLARLPYCALRIDPDTLNDDVEELLGWLEPVLIDWETR